MTAIPTFSRSPEASIRSCATNYNTPRVVFRNLGKGQFEELLGQAGPGVSALHSSRGCAFGDFDNDGDVDIVMVNHNEPPSLLRNDVDGANHWLKIKLTGVQSNRSAIGARVTVRYGDKIQVQEVLSQSSYLSVNDSRLHFGLGPAAVADIEIRWPLGRIEKLEKVAADQLILGEGRLGNCAGRTVRTLETMKHKARGFEHCWRSPARVWRWRRSRRSRPRGSCWPRASGTRR